MASNKIYSIFLSAYILKDISLWVLLFSNLVIIFFAIKDGWSFVVILWTYLSQGIIIGFFNIIRIIASKQLLLDRKIKISFNVFFPLFLYETIHLGLAEYFLNNFSLKPLEIKIILLNALLFFINHLFSYLYNMFKDANIRGVSELLFFPYFRVIPMYGILFLFSLFFQASSSLSYSLLLIIFLLLKTFSDIFMHIIHQLIREI